MVSSLEPRSISMEASIAHDFRTDILKDRTMPRVLTFSKFGLRLVAWRFAGVWILKFGGVSVRSLAASLYFLLTPVSTVLALNPSLPPSGNFDLSHWKLTLPVDSNGTNIGTAAEIQVAQMITGYTNALYFYTASDGAMLFWCPVDGASTSGSDYPRSELREMLNPSSTSVNWFAYGTHILTAQCKLTQIPSSKKVIIGQIHGFSTNIPLLKLQFNDGNIE